MALSGSGHRKAVRLSPPGRLALRALEKALAHVGERRPAHDEACGIGLPVSIDNWRRYFEQIAAEGGDVKNRNTMKSRWRRGQEDVLGKSVARQWASWVWKV